MFILNPDDTTEPLYDPDQNQINYANDMKVGPDGRLYVGTQSTGWLGLSDRADGKLFSIDKNGIVRTLLENLILSNGMDWSMDETRFYHTDSDTHTIREYAFDKGTGTIHYTGRKVTVPCVDGFTIDRQNRILAAGWGQGCIHVIDTETMDRNHGKNRTNPRSDLRPGKLCLYGENHGHTGSRNSRLRH